MIGMTYVAEKLSKLLGAAEGPLKVYREYKDIQDAFTNKGSILRLLKSYLIEPTIFVTKSVQEQCPDKVHDAIGEEIDLFCTFYSQAFKILTNVHGADSKVAIELLGTSGYDYSAGDAIERVLLSGVGGGARSPGTSYNSGKNSADVEIDSNVLAAFGHSQFLTFSTGLESILDVRRDFSLEATTPNNGKEKPGAVAGKVINQYTSDTSSSVNTINQLGSKLTYAETQRQLNDSKGGFGMDRNGNMSADVIADQPFYGYQIRNFNINIIKGTGSNAVVIQIPITVKANIVFLKVEEIVNALLPKSADKSFLRRWDKWRSGAISFWKDLILCSDLIEEYKKGKLKDKNNVMEHIQSAEIGAMSKLGTIKDIGYERFYNMYLCTSSDKKVIEQYLRGKLDSPRFKEDFLRKANGLQIFVLDPEWEIGQLYLKDIATPSNIKFKNIGKRKKGNDKDLNELFKSMYTSNPPSF